MFRFSIRDLLWLMMVVAVFGAWHVDSKWYRSRLDLASKTLHAIRQELWKEDRDLRITSEGGAMILNEKYSSDDHP
jgi:hypothetical protein